MFKVNNKNTKTTKKNINATSFTFLSVFISNFEHNSYSFLVFLMLAVNTHLLA